MTARVNERRFCQSSIQSDRPLASYRCGLYANSFLRDDEERNHTRLWKVDLIDGLPGLLDNRRLFERRRPKARFNKRKGFRGKGREQPVLEMSVGPPLYHHILPGLRGKDLLLWLDRFQSERQRRGNQPNCAPGEAKCR
jgi:hypothetical protein